ncbi:MAG TPA: DUF5647 family protein [Candidatus Brocadiaceae bacterium]
MSNEKIIKKNLDLFNEFMKYAFEHPEILDKIPPEAELVILPTNDPEHCTINRKMATALIKKGKKVVVVRFKIPKTTKPKIELITS